MDHDSPFEADVCRELVEAGWEVHAQVGCAGFAIDLAVVDPRAPGRYLLGIECDGATYHSAATAGSRSLAATGTGRAWVENLSRLVYGLVSPSPANQRAAPRKSLPSF